MRTTTRIQRQRTQGWRKPDQCVIVDRTSNFGNPFTVAQLLDIGYAEPEARQTAVAEFRPWLRGSRSNSQSTEGDQRREKILARLPELRGMDLACTCPPGETCHADVLLEWAALPVLALEVRIASTRARVDRQRAFRGERPLYDEVALAAVLTRDVGPGYPLVDVDLGNGIPQRWDGGTWNQHLRSQRMHQGAVTARLVEVFA
ncbi:DUF4326 domain-containing protein [Streptacidiphilus carbonis]|uniref:DUF4326 domain-containing protein n=1 Tax=Streptacidiphilus carbonis TaxID=105422 RepID=UPI0007C71B1A|nr:DUF4326 domain-containing protein [Streptacidiphilus carbonis]